MSADKKISVYYNSGCPVCKAGIEGQMEKDQSCPIQWKDVHDDNGLVGEIKSELEFVRERLHVVDAEGRLRIGFDAILELWKNSPSEKWKARLLGLPLIRQIGQLCYNIFAAGLYRWNRSKRHW